MRRVAQRFWRPALALVFMLVVFFGARVYGLLTVGMRVAPDVWPAAASERTVDVAVTLNFKPEDYHIKYLQGVATIGGVNGTTIELRRVSSVTLRQLAHTYWIGRVTLARAP